MLVSGIVLAGPFALLSVYRDSVYALGRRCELVLTIRGHWPAPYRPE